LDPKACQSSNLFQHPIKDRGIKAYHRTKCIWRLPDIKLFMIPLPLPGRHIINNSISPDITHRIFLRNAIRRLPNNHTNLALIVGRLRELRVRVDLVAIGDDRGEPLGEDDWMRRLVYVVGAVETRAVELFCVLGVVLAYT
jgi:hypothetical protein